MLFVLQQGKMSVFSNCKNNKCLFKLNNKCLFKLIIKCLNIYVVC